MKPAFFLRLLISFTALATPGFAQTFHPDYHDGMIFVKIKDTVNVELIDSSGTWHYDMDSLKTIYDLNYIGRPFDANDAAFLPVLSRTYLVLFNDTLKADSLIIDCSSKSYVEYAEKVPILTTFHIPNDFVATSQWYLTKINAPLAWDFSQGSPSVVIAVVDNGVRLTHADIKDNLWVNALEKNGLSGVDDDLNGYTDDVYGYDFADKDSNPNPPTTTNTSFSHGTHVAGIASATTNNNTGVASVGYNTSIMALKCAPDSSNGSQLNSVYTAVTYAADNGADVINMSFGGKGYSKTHQTIITYAHTKGAVLVAAAGNSNTDTAFYPAAYDHVISVGATDAADKKAGFSNYGTTIDIMAPGTSIYNTLARNDNDYGTLQGTSMASPIVAGLAGLMLSYRPTLTTTQVESLIEQGADKIDVLNPGYEGKLGAGRANAYNTFLKMGVSVTENESLESIIRIYPNPSQETTFIDIPMEGNKQINIFDISGRVVFTRETSGNSAAVESLPPGLYYLQVICNDQLYIKKLLRSE